ncbi:endonuclease/exonuclease/phosphatase family protein [Rhizobium sp.]|jgi:endonuclease/exonuclease/phosphatase (EEP) superfamily protein YafD|uniref:endonuclease/exonuclease/phosphatase family protein n=1 Tax=Rhizobium sp. TaxID=391 RepID=UPI000E92B8CE|nr:endonuclease [Rhizobium sp.]
MRVLLFHVGATLLCMALTVFALRYVADFWGPAVVFSLQLHAGVALVLLALFCLALRPGAVSLMMLCASVLIVGHAVLMVWNSRPLPFPTETAAAQNLRVLSFNILGENLENGGAIADYIVQSGADIAYVMEAEPVGLHLDRLSKTYPYRIGCGDHTTTCDLLLLSKYPLENIYVGNLSDLRKDRFAMAQIHVGSIPLNLAAAHLSKPYFDSYHTYELAGLGDALSKINGPVLLAGDFNAATIAPDMQELLKRTGMTTAGFEPATWPIGAGVLGVSIDHIFIRTPLMAKKLSRIPSNFGSNHYGLIADLVLHEQEF